MSKEFEYVRPEEQLSDVIEKMGQLDLHEISVSPDGKKLIGVVSYGTLLKRRNVSITTKAESVMVMPQLIGPESSVTTVAEAFLSSGYRQIPIVKGGSIQGTVTRADLIKIILDIKELKNVKVRDIMTADVRTVRLDDPVELAIMNMKNLDIRTLPVIDKDGNLSGIVGIKEVAAYNWKEKKRETVGEIVGNNTQVKVNVDSISIPSVATISPDDDIGKAVD